MQLPIRVYLESGPKRAIAGALDWPGWNRAGKDESDAMQRLLDYSDRYAAVVDPFELGFVSPQTIDKLTVIERLKGGSAIVMGVPEAAPHLDEQPMNAADLQRSFKLLHAYWQAFEKAARKARGKTLTKGPRGGGRDLEGIIRHVLESAGGGYLKVLGWKPVMPDKGELTKRVELIQKDMEAGLTAAAKGELPTRGPRGGKRWKPRYFVRRAGWHILDHAWEIEDRLR